MKSLLILFVCFISINVYSQNITNTLGTSGVFTIKDGTTTFATLRQAQVHLAFHVWRLTCLRQAGVSRLSNFPCFF